jgi:hypothetical protein
MIYLERKASPGLASCVETLWYACAPDVPHQRELVLPGGKIQFVISLAASHDLYGCPTFPRISCEVQWNYELHAAFLTESRTSGCQIAPRTGNTGRTVRWPIMTCSNAFPKRVEAVDGLRPSFSAHVRWCERGAPVLIPVGGNSDLSKDLA